MKFSITQFKTWLVAATMLTCSPWVHAICYKVTGIGTTTGTIPQAVADMGYTATSWGGGVELSCGADLIWNRHCGHRRTIIGTGGYRAGKR